MKLRSLAAPRRALVIVAVVFALLEFLDAFRIEETAFAIGFSIVTVAAAWWTTRGGIGGPVALALLASLELMGLFLFYPRPDSLLVWVDYSIFGLLAAAIIALAILTVVRERRKPAPAQTVTT